MTTRIAVAVAVLWMGGAATGGAQAPRPAQKEAGVSAEMKDFLAGWNGDYKAVKAALKKHGAPGLDDKDMGLMNLAAPKITASEVKAGRQCHTLEAKAGIMLRTYGVCWEGAKIVAVEDKGSR